MGRILLQNLQSFGREKNEAVPRVLVKDRNSSGPIDLLCDAHRFPLTAIDEIHVLQ